MRVDTLMADATCVMLPTHTPAPSAISIGTPRPTRDAITPQHALALGRAHEALPGKSEPACSQLEVVVTLGLALRRNLLFRQGHGAAANGQQVATGTGTGLSMKQARAKMSSEAQ